MAFQFNPRKKVERENTKLLKIVLKEVKAEILRLDAEIAECKNVLGGYEKFIVESVMFVTDRNNLTTSKICGAHASKMEDVRSQLAILSVSSTALSEVAGRTSATMADTTKALVDKTKRISSVLTTNSETMLALIPEFIQNINRKLTAIYEQKRYLEERYNALDGALKEYIKRTRK